MTARDDFLKVRRSGLGGSDVAAILGLSRRRTAVDVWLEKTGRAPGQPDALPLRFGQFAEDFVAREYERATGRRVQRFTATLRHPDHPHLLGHIDRLVVPAGAKRAAFRREIRTDTGLECKTAHPMQSRDIDEWGPAWSDEVPRAYWIQCQWYLGLTGCARWHLGVLFGNTEFRPYEIRAVPDLQAELFARAAAWWDRYVVGGEIPAPTCAADLSRLYAQDDGGAVEAGDETLSALDSLANVRREIARLTGIEEGLELDIKRAMGHAATLTGRDGKPLATWKSQKARAAFDLDLFLAALYPGVLPGELPLLSADVRRTYSAPGKSSRSFRLK